MIDEPFEYLTFGGTFGRAFALFFDRFDLYMAISGVVMIPFALIFVSLVIFVVSAAFSSYDPDCDYEYEYDCDESGHALLGVLVFGVEILAYALATVIGQGAITNAVAKIYIGQQAEWLKCLKSAWRRKWSLLGASLLVDGSLFVVLLLAWIAIFIAVWKPNAFTVILSIVWTIALIVGATYAYSGLLLASPAIMVEGFASPIRGVKRSWELSTGSRCYLVCTLISLTFVCNLAYAFLNNLFGSGNFYIAMVNPIDMLVRLIPLSIYFPLHSIIKTVLYLNLRIGRESMNHQVLSGDMMNDATPASRFRNDDPGAISQDSIDYRHVPLVDNNDDDRPNTSVV